MIVRLLPLLIIVWGVSFICLSQRVAAQDNFSRTPPLIDPNAQLDRAILVRIPFVKEGVTDPAGISIRFVQGPPRRSPPAPKDLFVKLVENSIVTRRFFLPNPLKRRQWVRRAPVGEFDVGDGTRHTVRELKAASLAVSLPLSAATERLHVYDAASNKLIISVDLSEAVKEYCAKNPKVLGCQRVPKDDGTSRRTDLFLERIANIPGKLGSGATLKAIEISLTNQGAATAIGTAAKPAKGYELSLGVWPLPLEIRDLGSDSERLSYMMATRVPIKGGPIETPTLKPGESWTQKVTLKLPKNLKKGRYCIGAFADSSARITESREGNNFRCAPVYISAP